MHPELKKAI
jgi:hypothetical protein